MSMKMLLCAAALALLPGLTFAQCSQTDKADQQAMSCAQGTIWDQSTGTCLALVNS